MIYQQKYVWFINHNQYFDKERPKVFQIEEKISLRIFSHHSFKIDKRISLKHLISFKDILLHKYLRSLLIFWNQFISIDANNHGISKPVKTGTLILESVK